MINGLSEGGKTPSLMGILYFIKRKLLVGRCRLELSSLLCFMNQLEQGWTLNFDSPLGWVTLKMHLPRPVSTCPKVQPHIHTPLIFLCITGSFRSFFILFLNNFRNSGNFHILAAISLLHFYWDNMQLCWACSRQRIIISMKNILFIKTLIPRLNKWAGYSVLFTRRKSYLSI